MANPLDPYLPKPALPMMTQQERLLAPKPAPQGEMRPWDSKIANVGAYIEDNSGMPNLGKVIQAAGLGSNEGIRPDQLVRAGAEVGMLAPQVRSTVGAVGLAAKNLPALYQGAAQGVKTALPALGNAAIEGTALAAAVTGNHELGDISNMARAGMRGLNNLTARRDLDIGRTGVADKQRFGNERDMLASAMRMARNGEHNMERIRQQTGWHTLPAPEGTKPQWAMEITDHRARIDPKVQDGNLSKQLNHPELYDHYPELAFTPRSANYDLGNTRGRLRPDDSMEFNPMHPGMQTERDQRGNALHEIQHWIQNREGWQRGGNPNTPAVQSAANSQLEDLFNSGHLSFDTPPKELMNIQQKMANNAYYNLAGEAHARVPTNRMDMTPQQRQQISPVEKGYDRARDELIYQ